MSSSDYQSRFLPICYEHFERIHNEIAHFLVEGNELTCIRESALRKHSTARARRGTLTALSYFFGEVRLFNHSGSNSEGSLP